MKCVLFLFVLGVAAIFAAEDRYTTKYDNINLDEILASDRLLNNYFNCVMDKGKCSPDGFELKTHIDDALNTNCTKCSEAQKQGADKVIHYIAQNKPKMWEDFKQKYDPTGIKTARYVA